jgi:hypothetical protein
MIKGERIALTAMVKCTTSGTATTLPISTGSSVMVRANPLPTRDQFETVIVVEIRVKGAA